MKPGSLFTPLIVSLLVAACGSSDNQTTAEAPVVTQNHQESGCVAEAATLQGVIDDSRRREANSSRDVYRHPSEVLEFFELQPDQTVVEIWPSGGWWTEILAPYLRDCGQYIAAGFALDARRTPGWRKRVQRQYNDWLAGDPGRFDKVQVSSLSIPERPEIAPAGSADRVLSFRNVHNWMNGDYAPAVFVSMYNALKPGGMLGLVEHRADPGTAHAQMLESGYVTEAHVIDMAEAAGFELLRSSELNANPKDTKDHPQGVWSLPPSYRGGEETRADYQVIGESDRMTLLFRKPN